MSEAVNGGGGIARKGRENAYATELWLDGPSAFWLHPEGPLSETTPDEWRAKQPKPADPFKQSGAYLAGLAAQSQLQNAMAYQQYQSLLNAQQNQFKAQFGLYGMLGLR